MNATRIRELILQANQARIEFDEQMRSVLKELERECRPESERQQHTGETLVLDGKPETEW